MSRRLLRKQAKLGDVIYEMLFRVKITDLSCKQNIIISSTNESNVCLCVREYKREAMPDRPEITDSIRYFVLLRNERFSR